VPEWLLFSLVASVVLTVVLNVALRMFPGAGRALGNLFDRITERVDTPSDEAGEAPDEPRVRVIVPWKLMLVASVILTVVINLLLRLA
jgi:hypothetical protein